MITDLSMSPNFEIGDYVGGLIEGEIQDIDKLKKIFGKICIINLISDIVIIRKIIKGKNNLILLYPINTEFEAEVVSLNDIRTIACIIWHRSNLK